MKRLWTLLLALAITLSAGAAAWASDLQVYAESGFCADQCLMGESLTPECEVTPWAAGASFTSGPWLLGADYIDRQIALPSRERDLSVTEGEPTLAIDTYDLYAGARLVSAKCFKLYGLAGFASDTAKFACPPITILGNMNGIAFGLGASLTAGPLIFDGKILTVPHADTSLALRHSCGEGWGEIGRNLDGGSMTMADARCLWPLNKQIAVYLAYHWIAADLAGEKTYHCGQASWYAAGVNIAFF